MHSYQRYNNVTLKNERQQLKRRPKHQNPYRTIRTHSPLTDWLMWDRSHTWKKLCIMHRTWINKADFCSWFQLIRIWYAMGMLLMSSIFMRSTILFSFSRPRRGLRYAVDVIVCVCMFAYKSIVHSFVCLSRLYVLFHWKRMGIVRMIEARAANASARALKHAVVRIKKEVK